MLLTDFRETDVGQAVSFREACMTSAEPPAILSYAAGMLELDDALRRLGGTGKRRTLASFGESIGVDRGSITNEELYRQ